MEKIKVTFDYTKPRKIILKLGKKSTTMTYKEYKNLIVPNQQNEDTFLKNLRKNIENYFADKE